ncbi:MAG: sulfate adenylyltransferase [Patescibacteria group bacterium]|nr:sulfate adenylyltransferase [Patescibacteria group bacterium]
MISPHGGKLVDKTFVGDASAETARLRKIVATLKIGPNQIQDIVNIAQGVFSPLDGFLRENEFLSVLNEMRLNDGTVWPIPIVLDVLTAEKKRLEQQEKILLIDSKNQPVAFLSNSSFFRFDKEEFALKVFGITDQNHPGVRDVFEMKEFLIGGKIELIGQFRESVVLKSPAEIRSEFLKRGWESIVAFQTRNVPHRGHEFLQKEALKKVDGLFVQPVIGEKKMDDFKDEYIIGSYEILIEKHFPAGKAMLGVLPLKMRYGGPKEALLHAIIRKNFGCTHFIVGRDHAGVGDFYHPTEAQEIFEQFGPSELGVEILKFPEVVFDKEKGKHCFVDECSESNRIRFSGTKLRDFVKNKKEPPRHLIRRDVFELLSSSDNSLVDENYKMKTSKRGFVLWFTGLSGAGKSTVADLVFEHLRGNGTRIERLDGDVVRENLAQDLGFSKKDRDENIRRIGFVADLLSRNGVGVIASFISPYQKQRDELRKEVENFIEVFVNAPLEICEERDPKGMYKKARAGEIKNFTGISDSYDSPKDPDIELRTDKGTPRECVQQVIDYLDEKGFI